MHANTMPSLYILTMTPSRACSVRLTLNIGGLVRPRPGSSGSTEPCYNEDMAQWLIVVYNFSAALSKAKQLRKACAQSVV